MQTQVIDHPEAETEDAVRQFLVDAGDATGACGEHDPAWLHVLSDGLDQRPFMLIARDEMDNIVGYLPLALVTSRLFGRFLVSLPAMPALLLHWSIERLNSPKRMTWITSNCDITAMLSSMTVSRPSAMRSYGWCWICRSRRTRFGTR